MLLEWSIITEIFMTSPEVKFFYSGKKLAIVKASSRDNKAVPQEDGGQRSSRLS